MVRSMEGGPESAGSSDCKVGATDAASSLGACLNHFGSMYSSRPSRPPSRPYPLSRYPPKPQAASNRFVQFTQTTPAFNCAATCSAMLRLSLQTHEANPYTVLLASSTRSFVVRNAIAASSG